MRVRDLVLAVLVLHAPAAAAHAQKAPAFEVASVKQNTSVSDEGYVRRPSPGQFRIQNVPRSTLW